MTVGTLAAIGLSRPATIVCFVAIGLYACAAVGFDRYMSARPTAELLKAYVRSLQLGAPDDRQAAVSTVVASCNAAAGGQGWFKSLYSSRITAGWREAHALEQLLAADLPAETALAQLTSAAGALKRLSLAEAKALGAEIDLVVRNARKPKPDPPIREGQVNALLAAALTLIHKERDDAYENEAGIESKALALSLVGLLLIVVAGVALHRETLLLFGAVGGFLSRLFRVLKRRPSQSDYGASWSTLMLAPIVGALAGWAGVAILGVLADLHVLDAAFLRPWETPRSVLALGLAAVLGFSERLFDRVVSLTEGAVTPAEAKPPAAGAPPANGAVASP